MTKNTAPNGNYPLGSALDFLQCMWRLDRALEQLSSRMEKRFGITAQQSLVIRCVGKYPGMTAGQLAALLHVDPGTVSAALKRLEDKRLIERRRDPRDKRRVTLGLSAQGRQLEHSAADSLEHAVDQLLASRTPADLATTRAVLDELTACLGSR